MYVNIRLINIPIFEVFHDFLTSLDSSLVWHSNVEDYHAKVVDFLSENCINSCLTINDFDHMVELLLEYRFKLHQ